MSRVGKAKPYRSFGIFGSNAAPLVLSALLFVPAEWSPDGKRLAFLAREGDAADLLPAGWLFSTSSASPPPRSAFPRTCALWIADLDAHSATRLEQTEGLISHPVWAPDGRSVVYAQFQPNAPVVESADTVGGRLLWMRRHHDGRAETLRTRAGSFRRSEVLGLPQRRSAWSPNGLWLALPDLAPSRLVLMPPDARSVVAELPEADLPAFSPDSHWLAFHQTNPAAISVIPVGRWSERQDVLEVANPVQPVTWERAGSFFLAMRVIGNVGAEVNTPLQIELVRVAASSGEKQLIQRQSVTPKEEEAFLDVFFAYSPRNESLLLPLYQDGRSVGFDWQVSGSSVARWHPVDDEAARWPIHLGAPTISPDGRRMAFRFGQSDWAAPVAVCEIERRAAAIWAPNEATRMRALFVLVEALKDWLIEGAETPEKTGAIRVPLVTPRRPAVRPLPSAVALFPFPSPQALLPEAAAGYEPGDPIRREAIERLARLGLELARRSPYGPKSPFARSRLEAELLFAYTLGQFGRANAIIDRLETDASGPVHARLVLEVIRAQCLAALGKNVAALDAARRLRDERLAELRASRNVGEQRELRLLAIATDAGWATNLEEDPIVARLRTIEEICALFDD